MAGSTFALPSTGRFSASGFLPDVRAAGATYFNYVGKPLSYILATPEQPDDADNPLVRAFGNEGSIDDVARFAERFGVAVTDCLRVDRRRRHRGAHARHAAGRARVGSGGDRRPRPVHRRGVPAGPLRRAGAPAQRGGGHRRAGVQGRRRRLRGLLAQRRGAAHPPARGLVLDGRPGLPRRERVLLLRRARPRLVAGGRRELCLGADRADHAAPSRRRPGRRLRRAGSGRGRPGHGGRAAAARARRVSTATSSRPSWPPRATWARSGRPASSA